MVSLFEDLGLQPVGNLVSGVRRSHTEGLQHLTKEEDHRTKNRLQFQPSPAHLQSVLSPLVQLSTPPGLGDSMGKPSGAKGSFSRYQLKAS